MSVESSHLTPHFQPPELIDYPQPEDDFQYKLLVGHNRVDGTYKSTDTLHTEYVRLTDNLIHQMVDGVEIVDPHTGEKDTRPVDFVVWLDKSARPLAWLTRDLWSTLAADAEGNIPKQPESRFVNIDRNQWVGNIDPDGTGLTDVASLDETIIRSLRSVFLSNPNDRKQGLTEDIDEVPTQFDGKTVLIVDEVLSSGRTLQYAVNFFKRAFPDAAIAGTHWMGGQTTKNGGQSVGNADLPVWYDAKTQYGRGVGERNVPVSSRSESSVQRLGAYFLSTALREPDHKSQQLRKELHELAEDVRNQNMLVQPSGKRDVDDMDERVLRFNDVDNVDEFFRLRRAQDEPKRR